MYIAHYKSVNSASEFFSEARDTLDFPTQVSYKKERYLLFATHIASTNNQRKNIESRANQLNIKCNVKI